MKDQRAAAMTNRDSTDWTEEWLKVQRRYAEGWARRGTPNSTAKPDSSTPDPDPWSEALGHWWQLTAPTVSPSSQEFVSKLVKQGQSYSRNAMGLVQAVESAMGHTQAAGDAPDWSGAFTQMVEAWNNAVPFPAMFKEGLMEATMRDLAEHTSERLQQLLAVPSIGLGRETQDQLQELARLGLKYQNAWRDYVAVHGEIGKESAHALVQALGDLAAQGESIETYRELYDLWVDRCERVYAKHVTSDEYVGIFGALVNSLMAYKLHCTHVAEPVLRGLGLSTQSEVETLSQRLHTLRREHSVVRAELEKLREVVRELEARSGDIKPDTGDTPRKRKVARKPSLVTRAPHKSGARGVKR